MCWLKSVRTNSAALSAANSARGRERRALLATMTKSADGGRIRQTRNAAFCAGARIDLARHFPRKGRCVTLPKYPGSITPAPWNGGSGRPDVPPDEGACRARPQREHATWESRSMRNFPFLPTTMLAWSIVFPAAGFVELALEASQALHGGDFHEVEMLETAGRLSSRAGR